MRIGGTARYFAELLTKEDVREALAFATQKNIRLVPLGSGSNTIFDDAEIHALVVRVKHETVTVDSNRIVVGTGKNLPMLINELAVLGLNLSALTGIPGTVGGAIFGNAGQGPKGMWIDTFIESVTVCIDGEWKEYTKSACEFAYRESIFKHHPSATPPLLWEATFVVPSGEPTQIQKTVQELLQKRIETQPHVKTAGSCFKAVQETPAWKLIDTAGLRGYKIGGIEISPKHANFLINVGEAKFSDAVEIVEKVRATVAEPLEVEMRFIKEDGTLKF